MPVNQDYSENVVLTGDFARTPIAVISTGADYIQFLDATDGLVKRTLASALGGAGSGAAGTATIDFGAFPGGSDASVAVTGQTGILSGSVVQAWLVAQDSADHTADEHRVETISVTAGNIVAGTGFTIYAQNTSQLNEPLIQPGNNQNRNALTMTLGASSPSVGGIGTMIYGTWTVHWRWS